MRSTRRFTIPSLAAVALSAIAMAGPGALEAQGDAGRAAVAGRVVEALSGKPLTQAVVRLRTAADTATLRVSVTDREGRYRFGMLEPGVYELVVVRLGYRPRAVRVELTRPAEARVSLGLELEPIRLEPLPVVGRPVAPYDRDLTLDVQGAGQLAAVRLRQAAHLASDVRSLTHAELLGSVTLGESDLFRAIQRLPGVSTRDDWTAELWTRGAAWDETTIHFDGLPLFNPLHGAGVLGGVNSDGVGAVYLHPGVRPDGAGEGGALLDLESRPGGTAGRLQGFGEVSLASARLALDAPLAGGRGGWMVAGRRTYLDAFSRAVASLFDIREAYIPYAFTDLTGRLDYPLGNGRHLEVSGLGEVDRLTGNIPDVIHGSTVAWGNIAGRVTLSHSLRGLRARHTVGMTGYGVNADSVGARTVDGLTAGTAGEIDHTLLHAVARTELTRGGGDRHTADGSVPASGRAGWRAGYELVAKSAVAEGDTPPMYLAYRTTAEDSISRRDALVLLGAWYDRRWVFGLLELDAGIRSEVGTAVAGGGPLRLSPRAVARLRPFGPLTLSAGAGRSWQYAQMLAPIGFTRSDFPSGHLWLLAAGDVPALRSDVGTVGGELWIGGAWLLSGTAYVRRETGVVAPDPRPGQTLGRPLFVELTQRRRGVELSARRLEGRVTGAVSYTRGRAEHALDTLVFPTIADRRHILDGTAQARLAEWARVAAAFTYATGSPYTRVVHLGFDPASGHSIGVVGAPNAGRGPDYFSLDVMLDVEKRLRSWTLGGFFQIRNLGAHPNVGTYTGTQQHCPSGGYSYEPEGLRCYPGGTLPVLRDEFLFGMPLLPLFGFRATF